MLDHSAAKLAALILILTVTQPAMAQEDVPIVPPDAETVLPPDAWTAVPSLSAVQISKTAKDGTTQFVGGCDKRLGPGLTGSFSGYRGADLQRIDGQSERVLFYVSGAEWKEAFAVQLRYSARRQSWEIAKMLAPVFVNSFARGGELTVLNSARQAVFSFDLTGSSNAARTMRSTCGF